MNKRIYITEEQLKNITQCETINKNLLNESLSSTLFHFCPISSAYYIICNNEFKLTPDGTTKSDSYMNRLPVDANTEKRFPFYMCFSRTPYSGVGYISIRRQSSGGDWKKCIVRLEIDGDMLNQKYTGRPVDSNNRTNKRNKPVEKDNVRGTEIYKIKKDAPSLRQEFIPYNMAYYPLKYVDNKLVPTRTRGRKLKSPVNFDLIDQKQRFEYEDRLYSYSPIIPNALKYIKRIDILCTTRTINGYSNDSNDVKKMIYTIYQKCGNIVHIYNSETEFNNLKKNKEDLDNQNYDLSGWGDHNIDMTNLTTHEFNEIARVLGCICYGEDKDTIDEIVNSFTSDEGNKEYLLNKVYSNMAGIVSKDYFRNIGIAIRQAPKKFRGGKQWVQEKLKDYINKINSLDIERFGLKNATIITTKSWIFDILNVKK